MRRSVFPAAFAACLFAGIAIAGPTAAQAPAPSVAHSAPPIAARSTPIWSSSFTQISALSPTPAAIGSGVKIRPPLGFSLTRRPSPDGFGSVSLWAGPRRPVGLGTQLAVILATPPPSAGSLSVLQVLLSLIASFHSAHSNWTSTAIESGRINGLNFERVHWAGTSNVTNGKVHGMDYASQVKPGIFVIIAGEDSDPMSAKTLPILEASAQTVTVR